MMGSTHRAAAVTLWVGGVDGAEALGAHLHTSTVVVGAVIAYACATLPDIDNPRSRLGRKLNRAIPNSVTWLEDRYGHRGPTHYAITHLIVGGVLAALGMITMATARHSGIRVHDGHGWMLGAIVGGTLLSHSIGDCLTWQGVRLFAPFSNRVIRPRYGRRFECNGPFERLFLRPALIVAAVGVCVGQAYLITT